MHAEIAYLFRHALLRDMAYQLQVPSDRSRIHRLALEILEVVLDARAIDAAALELADHALLSGADGMRARERAYLERAVEYFERQYQPLAVMNACRRIVEHPASDATQRVDWQLRAANTGLLAGEFAKALEFAQQAVAGTAESRNIEHAPRGLRLCGMLRDSAGERDVALSLFKQARDLAQRSGAKREFARALAGIANLLGRSGRIAEAESAFDDARRAVSGLDDTEGKFSLEFHHAQFLIIAGRESAALPALLAAQSDALARSNRRDLVHVKLAIGVAQLANPDPREAEQTLLETAALALEMNDRRTWSVARHNLADIWVHSGRHADALDVFHVNLAILRETGELSEEALTLRRIASIYLDVGRLAEARTACEEAIESARRTADVREQGSALAFLAKILHRQGSTDRALAAYEEAIAVLHQSGDRRREAIVQWHRADMHQECGRKELARRDLEEVRRILVDVDDTANLPVLDEQLQALR